jgi:hypothetical protein
MEESTKKIKPGGQCNALNFFTFGKHAAAAILQGTEITGTTQEIISGGVQLETLLNALGVRPEELCQDKARNLLYNLSDSLRG